MPTKLRSPLPSSVSDTGEEANCIAVFLSKSDESPVKLTRPRNMKNPSLVFQLTENRASHRDGSSSYPIELPGLKRYNGEAVSEIIVRLNDGSLAAWNVGGFTGRKKLILENGSLKMAEDLLPDLFAGNICEGTCNDVDAVLAVKAIVDNDCLGQPPVTRFQIVRIPKCCCAESTPVETCEPSTDYDNVLSTGDITI